jgi:hypothetical protein
MEFEGTAAARAILDAVKALRYWNAEVIRKVATSAPVEFVPPKWRDYVALRVNRSTATTTNSVF